MHDRRMATLSDRELEYLGTQRLGRLATLAPDGYPQNNPVGFFYNAELGTIDIGGHKLGDTRKFGNVRAHPKATLVVDDLASVQPWHVRGVEIRGDVEALVDVEPPMPGMSREIIRIHPARIRSWGLASD
jgi:pyridoxamine 5'-phosphate oxidase family protein